MKKEHKVVTTSCALGNPGTLYGQQGRIVKEIEKMFIAVGADPAFVRSTLEEVEKSFLSNCRHIMLKEDNTPFKKGCEHDGKN